MTASDRIRDELAKVTGFSPRQAPGGWKARCPAHEDRNPSLSVRAIEGAALVYCHAGCDTDNVLAALNMTRRDLYDQQGRYQAEYRYLTPLGAVSRVVQRIEQASGKTFRQSITEPGAPILYRLPQVLAAVAAGTPVYLVEGEKDVHALESLGAVATTAPQGAANFHLADVSPLKGATVTAVVDRDGSGAKWAASVRDRLDGYAARLRMVEAAHGKDAADHVAAGHGLGDFTPFEFAHDQADESWSGSGSGDDRPPRTAEEQTAVAVLAEAHRIRVQREAKRLVDAEQRPQVALPEILTLRERLARPVPPIAWRIQDWQPADARVILAAQFKAGKTTLSGNLVRCLVDGDLFLGQHKVNPIRGNLGLVDFEMSARQLDQWLRDQRIVNDDRVIVLPLRGAASTFDLADPDTRSRWARLLRELDITYLLWDCFRPVLDALGLDEHRDAGRLLTGFDAMLTEADVTEATIVHHMGHSGERSRGDSRIRDWPDVEWRLVRQDDDPASPRFITAFGRDVDVPESQLSYDPVTRHLSLSGGSRKDAAATAALTDVLALLAATPKLSGRQIDEQLAETTDHNRSAVREAVKTGIADGKIVTEPGPRRAVLHSLCASAPECVASAPAHSSECASALIGSALHSDPREGSSAPDVLLPPGNSSLPDGFGEWSA